jgi:hypothetical protein
VAQVTIDAIAQLRFTERHDRGQARFMEAFHRHQGTLLVTEASADTAVLPVSDPA